MKSICNFGQRVAAFVDSRVSDGDSAPAPGYVHLPSHSRIIYPVTRPTGFHPITSPLFYRLGSDYLTVFKLVRILLYKAIGNIANPTVKAVRGVQVAMLALAERLMKRRR